MRTLTLITLAVTSGFLTGCLATTGMSTYYSYQNSREYSHQVCEQEEPRPYYGQQAPRSQMIPMSAAVSPHEAPYYPRQSVVERPILPAGFPCPERVPDYHVVRAQTGEQYIVIENR